MALLPSSSTASDGGFTHKHDHDVFLSFRGTDTRYGFTGNLYKALCDRGFRTFIDDEELNKGDQITPSLLKAIEHSRIAIVVLSENYASSSFCLDELSKIIDCIHEKGQLVLPVFHDVDPSDVRHLRGAYGEAMAKHEERFKDNLEKLQKWRMALQQVASLSGWHFKHGDGYEYEFIGKILEEVSRNIKCVALLVADHPVGLESQVLNLNSLLKVEFDDRVHMIGIHGPGGIGKTTLALAVYNSITHHFEGSCFLENVREGSDRHGLLHLQKTLLSKIIGTMNTELTSVKEASSMIQQRLRQKKVLLILDDVDKREQLEAIVGRPEWFGSGSRVIITTRDQHLLTCHGVERKYEVWGLDKNDALKLLRWKAFKTDEVNPSYVDILDRAVIYASGLPLALEVIGSHLFKKSIEEWKVALDRYERIPNQEIQKVLKVSYDALDEQEKSVFLDIACCFRGYTLAEVEDILHTHYGDSQKHHIEVLVEKSLIKIIRSENYVILHDLIEDMGKEIVRLESPREPGKRSRLWFYKDIIEVLKENTGSSEIELICLNIPEFGEVAECEAEAFKKMENLRTLVVKKCYFSKNSKYLPTSLRVLIWDRYSSEDLPFDFHPKKLPTCKFDSGCFTLFMSAELVKKKFLNMRVLIVDNSALLQIPDVSGLPNLETFSFKKCLHLVTIHNSVGRLGKLKILHANDCSSLRRFPPLELASLEELDLSFCCSLKRFPSVVGSLCKLKILKVIGCRKLKNFPPLKLASLEQLDLSWCRSLERFPHVVGSLDKLQMLNIEGCGKLKNFPPLKLASLEQLDFSSCRSLESFSPMAGSLGKVKILRVENCRKLKNFPPLEMTSLEELKISNCESLESFPLVVGSLGKLKILSFDDCRKLKNLPPLEMASLEELQISSCNSLESFPLAVGSLGKLKIFSVQNCRKLKNFPPLEIASLEILCTSDCSRLETFPLEVGSLGKLKILRVKGCRMLKNVPPLVSPSIEELDLSYCSSLESFPEILGKMKNIKHFDLEKTPIKKLPYSFQNLTGLEQLRLSNCGIVEIPSSIVLMPNLHSLIITKGGLLFPKQDGSEEKVTPMQTSKVKYILLQGCNLVDESLAIVLAWFSNVEELVLSHCEFTIVPECIKECRLLSELTVDYCEQLQEIRGLPPNLKTFSAQNCTSLTSSSRRKLMNQEVHEAGNTFFCVPSLEAGRLPKWFEHQIRLVISSLTTSFSFWFRNNLPDNMLLCFALVACPLLLREMYYTARFTFEFEENIYVPINNVVRMSMDHTFIFDLPVEKNSGYNMDRALPENEWNHAKAMVKFTNVKGEQMSIAEEIMISQELMSMDIGICALKDKSSMKDIRFTDPYENRNLDMNLPPVPENHVNTEHTL